MSYEIDDEIFFSHKYCNYHYSITKQGSTGTIVDIKYFNNKIYKYRIKFSKVPNMRELYITDTFEFTEQELNEYTTVINSKYNNSNSSSKYWKIINKIKSMEQKRIEAGYMF